MSEKKTDEKIEYLVARVKEGWTDQEIADQLKVSKNTVATWRVELGIFKKKGNGSLSPVKRKQQREKMLKKDFPVYKFYWKIGKDGVSRGKRTREEVAEKFKISGSRVSYIIKRYKMNLFNLSNEQGRVKSEIEKFVLRTIKKRKDEQ